MGYISIINKWNLEENKWQEPLTKEDKGRSASFANYKGIYNNVEAGIDYVILAYGTRLEDHSKNFQDIKDTKCGIDKIISYFENKNKNVNVQLYMMDTDAPIVEDAKLLAEYIDKLANQIGVNSINFVGLSKGGAMAFHIPKYFKNPASFSKSNIYTVASPFEGTRMASPKIFYPDVKKLIISKLGDNKLSNSVYKALISFYESISSNSHMDYDIAMLGGIPDDKLHLYDDSLIKDMFSNQNINAITKVANYKNLVTGIDDKTLKESLKTMNVLPTKIDAIKKLGSF